MRLYLIALLVLLSCSSSTDNSDYSVRYPSLDNQLSSKQLAQAYCGSCHLYPEPELLPKPVWDNRVLKNMASRLGILTDNYDPFKQLSMYDAFTLRHHNIYPKDSLITQADWKKIVDYYLEQSPDQALPQMIKEPVVGYLPNFELIVVDDLPTEPLATMVNIDAVSNSVYWGSRLGDLMIIDRQGKLKKQLSLDSPPSSMILQGGLGFLTTMGIMDPSEEAMGSLYRIHDNTADKIYSDLQRPVHLSKVDIDRNGSDDFVISQFGNQTGRLSWLKAGPKQTLTEYVIKNTPGAVQTEIRDFNNDGKLDIMSLFGQGDEGISIFYQKKSGTFSEKKILRFPPVYGSSSFQLVDFNSDGELDILYSNGDNADYSYSLKAYHGIRIYLNRGNHEFEETFFYPMFGTTKSIANDYDQDGDFDIMAIGFFPDFMANRPEGFVYLENQGNLEFKPYTFPEAENGRWLVADAGDIDGDGDIDVVLGSLLFKIDTAPPELLERWTKHRYHMILLKNTSINYSP